MTDYTWTVIGAGPAGIAAVGRLLDHGVADAEIAWVDPHFAAGDFGGKWRAVSSNTSVANFLDYLTASPAFGFADSPAFELNRLAPEQTCPLGLVADPLVWISRRLYERVSPLRTLATGLVLRDRRWTVDTEAGPITSRNVVLATGSVPRKLPGIACEEIPIESVLDPQRLSEVPLQGRTVGVFGSSHSTMIALPNLLATSATKVINFYRSPLKYAVQLDDWTVYDDTGLKGQAACWARENIDGTLPDRLERYQVDDPDFATMLRRCDRVVYTVGFERRRLPSTPQWGTLDYDAATGVLAPGLFGLGIAFPEYWVDPLGGGQYRVGLRKFMQRLNTVLPLWLRYGT
ncbi:FAD/NAD(P)-binding protein [Mycobacterium sp. 1274756.6]|uniref:FAD/NAD(P)-binding protein n=1 Tax=Mycobacterium sp. 1274756.6 TaxID=1834076 RepID=UPI0007FD0DF1|nr:FAD/NAD(P)-binding protein [Mycobacterium sp. 1274756.6]OBJ74016.1 pyridine nucleotide-disulfide oxidoreductase [Mycobacterium sp. 1274756.6]